MVTRRIALVTLLLPLPWLSACDIPVKAGWYSCDPAVEGACPPGYECEWDAEAGENRCVETGSTGPGCGNGVVDQGEACDGQDLAGTTCQILGFTGGILACTADCQLDDSDCDRPPGCGDGILDPTEDCDGPNLGGATCETMGFGTGTLGCTQACRFNAANCSDPPLCGNGVLEYGEGCDDGNVTAGDGCGTTCVPEICGDGHLDPGEACDDGNIASGDGCSADCRSDETCGNGVLDTAAGETCDDGNTTNSDGCSAECQTEGCGDGVLQPWEVCDDGNTANGDGCAANCLSDETCGNGVLDTAVGEGCDDGNTANGDGCSGLCRLEACGNGIVDAGEACDDGNTQGGDGCSATCLSDETCDNGFLDSLAGEQCDLQNLGGATCLSVTGKPLGQLQCSLTCQFDVSDCHDCGDGAAEGPELCDGADLNGGTCAAQTGGTYPDGTPACLTTCDGFDTAGCHDCGNGTLEGSEVCDTVVPGGETCAGHTGGLLPEGALACAAGCLGYDTSDCHDCGNGTIEGDEACDSADVGTETCASQTGDTLPDGDLACAAGCHGFDTSGCHSCGNNTVEGPEVCDTTVPGTETCSGHTGGLLPEGALACAAGCLGYDTSDCHDCGNGTIEGGEACDSADVGTETCASQTGGTLPDGDLACAAGCQGFDTSGCYECGNGTIEGSEVCDGASVGSATCASQTGGALPDGDLACAPGCQGFDTSGCHNCGNGVVEGPEACDGSVPGQSCISLGYGTGVLGCDSSCQVDTSQCVQCTWEWQKFQGGSLAANAPWSAYRRGMVWMEGVGPNDGKVYVHGGYWGTQTYASMLDPDTLLWTITTDISDANREEAVWTGSEVFIWTGTAQRYDPFADVLIPVNSGGAPTDQYMKPLWVGSDAMLWRGECGYLYNPGSNAWRQACAGCSSCPPYISEGFSWIWTGTEAIGWGGTGDTDYGYRYNPATDTWSNTTRSGACPDGREFHTAVWTGNEMIIWGGMGYGFYDDGGRYNPTTNTWQTISTVGAPLPRVYHTAVWTGAEMIVWGGFADYGSNRYDTNTGGHYDPATDTWRPTAQTNAPDSRREHAAVWTGEEMIVYGGRYWNYSGNSYSPRFNGGRYWCNPNP